MRLGVVVGAQGGRYPHAYSAGTPDRNRHGMWHVPHANVVPQRQCKSLQLMQVEYLNRKPATHICNSLDAGP